MGFKDFLLPPTAKEGDPCPAPGCGGKLRVNPHAHHGLVCLPWWGLHFRRLTEAEFNEACERFKVCPRPGREPWDEYDELNPKARN